MNLATTSRIALLVAGLYAGASWSAALPQRHADKAPACPTAVENIGKVGETAGHPDLQNQQKPGADKSRKAAPAAQDGQTNVASDNKPAAPEIAGKQKTAGQ